MDFGILKPSQKSNGIGLGSLLDLYSNIIEPSKSLESYSAGWSFNQNRFSPKLLYLDESISLAK